MQVKLVKVLDCEENPKVLLSFLNNGLRNIMRKLNYTEIGRSGKYFNVHEKKSIDNLMMFSGYKSNFVLLENGYSLRVDSVKKIVRNQTVLDYINEIWKMNQDKERLEKRNILQNNLVGKIVMTNYGSTNYHRVEEIIYEELDTVLIIDSNNLMAESATSGSMLNESGTISGSSFGDNNQS